MQLKAALEAYLEYLQASGKSEMTLYTYGKDAIQILDFFGDKPVSNLSRLNIGKFLKSPELLEMKGGKGRAPHTVNKTRGFLRRFVLWCLNEGHIQENPLPKELLTKKKAASPQSSELGAHSPND